MIDTMELKACMARRGKTQADVAKACHMSDKTFYNKMKKGVFGSDEIETMIDYLEIEQPMSVFFLKRK